ncbi:5148_t:CDS:10 [Paraglomus occultum]|uniref:Dymeclin n=1 Tax=Paraglomus occultum TaxID=144539 RepID=A0A9N8VS09_9GLOM|nr:5148_t:CDS:10 [Paraglomus occultum]
MSSTTGDSKPIARPPQLYRVSTHATYQVTSPPTSASTSTFKGPTLSHTQTPSLHDRKAPLPLNLATKDTDHSELLFPQPSITSPATVGLPPPILSPYGLNPPSPSGSRRASGSTTQLAIPISIVQRKSLTEITVFTSEQYRSLKHFCSDKTIAIDDSETWESMLSVQKFPVIDPGQDAFDIDMATVSLAIELVSNNRKTKNFNTLLQHTLNQMYRLLNQDFTGEVPVEAYNSLFLVHIFVKQFICSLTGDEIHCHFEARNNAGGSESFADEHEQNINNFSIDPKILHDSRPMAEQLLDALISVILYLNPVASATAYEYYQECLNTFVILVSTQLHQLSASCGDNYFLAILFSKFSHLINDLTNRLVTNLIEQKSMPPVSTNVVYNAYSYLFSSKSPTALSLDPHPVPERSFILLLLLAVQPGEFGGKGGNEFRNSIARLKDELGSKDQDSAISFRLLYRVIYQQLPSEEICLLFYLLMIENNEFKAYVLSRSDPEIFLLPILRLLYEAIERRPNYPQVYICLAILLIFSEDNVFNENIQKVLCQQQIPYQSWLTERLLKQISLGGLVYLVLIRMIQLNLTSHRDLYIHTHCIAILANIASTVTDIQPYVAQRIVNLFDIVTKKYQKLRTRAREANNDDNQVDYIIYGDLVCLILEIINSILTRRLAQNPQLIYSLLHKKDTFLRFQKYKRFSELIDNVDNVISYFHIRIAEANLRAPSTEEVTEIIQTATRTWPPGRLKDSPDLKFKYSEGSDSHEFFCPYVWSIIYRRMWTYWDEEKARIIRDYVISDDESNEVDDISSTISTV